MSGRFISSPRHVVRKEMLVDGCDVRGMYRVQVVCENVWATPAHSHQPLAPRHASPPSGPHRALPRCPNIGRQRSHLGVRHLHLPHGHGRPGPCAEAHRRLALELLDTLGHGLEGRVRRQEWGGLIPSSLQDTESKPHESMFTTFVAKLGARSAPVCDTSRHDGTAKGRSGVHLLVNERARST